MIDSLNTVSGNSKFGKVLRFMMNRIPKSHVAKVRSGVNAGSRWVVGTSIHRCWLGSYEADKQALLTNLIKPGQVLWDVGANAGFYTLAFSRLTGPGGHVYSFEPLGANVKNLNRHIELNQLTNTTVIQAGLSEVTGFCGFDTGISHQKGFLSKEKTHYLVPCTTADDFIRQTGQAAIPALMKIDIEGAESAMLLGARELLMRHHPLLLLALHGDEQREKCFHLLKSTDIASRH